MCCGPSTSARILGLLSVIIAIGLIGTSAWVFQEYYEQYDSAIGRAANTIVKGIDNLFGTDVRKYTTTELKVYVYCSGLTLGIGGLQLLTSVFLLISGGGKSRAPGCTYSLVNSVGLVGIIAVIICIASNQYVTADNWRNRPERDLYWFGMMFINIVFYTIGSCIAGCFTRSQ